MDPKVDRTWFIAITEMNVTTVLKPQIRYMNLLKPSGLFTYHQV